MTENETDHITVSRRFKKSLEDVRNKRGADIGSDNHSIVAQLRIKIKQTRKSRKKTARRYDVANLRKSDRRELFNLYLRDRFSVLTEETTDSVKEEWAFEDVIGYKNNTKKELTSEEKRDKITRREKIKGRINVSKTRK